MDTFTNLLANLYGSAEPVEPDGNERADGTFFKDAVDLVELN